MPQGSFQAKHQLTDLSSPPTEFRRVSFGKGIYITLNDGSKQPIATVD
jgi:hypothetical protein